VVVVEGATVEPVVVDLPPVELDEEAAVVDGVPVVAVVEGSDDPSPPHAARRRASEEARTSMRRRMPGAYGDARGTPHRQLRRRSMPSGRGPEASVKNDRRTIFGWAMYDWANSAYSTVIAGAILPVYFANEVVGDGGWNGRSGESLWALTLSLGTLLMFLAMPVLGAIADYSASKRRFMQAFAYGGALFTTGLFFARSGSVVYTLGFFLLAQIGFVGANVFYDGFLPDITTSDTIDRVSSRGFALGYVGGGVYLAIVFAAVFLAPEDSTVLVTRVGVAGTGLWWAGFSAFAFSRLHETGASERLPATVEVSRDLVRGLASLVGVVVIGTIGLVLTLNSDLPVVVFDLLVGAVMIVLVVAVVRIARRTTDGGARMSVRHPLGKMAAIGISRTFATADKLRAFPQLLLFILAYMLYNDGVQTTINVSAVYGADTLGLETLDIALTFLIVQFVAFGGALLFGWVAARIDVKRAIQVNLLVWIPVAVGAFFIPEGAAWAFQGLGVVIGLVLGGIQALSRSLYGSMIPEEASAEFYGFYSVFSKFSAIWGPLIFAVVGSATGSGRYAILSIILFFVVGFALFSRVDIAEARASKDRWAFEGARADTTGSP
jgi:UMF1 family MFS transporter